MEILQFSVHIQKLWKIQKIELKNLNISSLELVIKISSQIMFYEANMNIFQQ